MGHLGPIADRQLWSDFNGKRTYSGKERTLPLWRKAPQHRPFRTASITCCWSSCARSRQLQYTLVKCINMVWIEGAVLKQLSKKVTFFDVRHQHNCPVDRARSGKVIGSTAFAIASIRYALTRSFREACQVHCSRLTPPSSSGQGQQPLEATIFFKLSCFGEDVCKCLVQSTRNHRAFAIAYGGVQYR